MATNKALFACTKCHSRHPFEDLSTEEQLCKACRRKYPLVACIYCRLEFHLLKKVSEEPVCGKCHQSLDLYGQPKNCKYCTIKAAFKESRCARCAASEKKYGQPVRCQRCKLVCAFDKRPASKEKVGGQVLCLLCTLTYKRILHKEQKKSKREARTVSSRKDVEQMQAHLTEERLNSRSPVATLSAENIASQVKARIVASAGNSRSNSPFRSALESSHDSSQAHNEQSYGDHVAEVTKLKDEITILKRIVSQKDKMILEKDKKISEFQANQWEKEKSLRNRIQAMQKEHGQQMDVLRLENHSLKKQLSTMSKANRSSRNQRPSGFNLGGGIRLHPDIARIIPSKSTPTSEVNGGEDERKNDGDSNVEPPGLDEEGAQSKPMMSGLEVDDSYIGSGRDDNSNKDADLKAKRKRKGNLLLDSQDSNASSGMDEELERMRQRKKKKSQIMEDEEETSNNGLLAKCSDSERSVRRAAKKVRGVGGVDDKDDHDVDDGDDDTNQLTIADNEDSDNDTGAQSDAEEAELEEQRTSASSNEDTPMDTPLDTPADSPTGALAYVSGRSVGSGGSTRVSSTGSPASHSRSPTDEADSAPQTPRSSSVGEEDDDAETRVESGDEEDRAFIPAGLDSYGDRSP